MNLSNMVKTKSGAYYYTDVPRLEYAGEDAEVLDLVFKYLRKGGL